MAKSLIIFIFISVFSYCMAESRYSRDRMFINEILVSIQQYKKRNHVEPSIQTNEILSNLASEYFLENIKYLKNRKKSEGGPREVLVVFEKDICIVLMVEPKEFTITERVSAYMSGTQGQPEGQ